jgi:transcriptional regulator with XRE-family HTH domain
MGEFGDALKAARTGAKRKLRETSEATGLSVSYLSDIEQGRKSPPDIDVVRKLQDFLGITDDSLVYLAERERTKMPTQMFQSFQAKPKLHDLFFRLKNLSDEELEDFLNKLPDE